MSMIVIERIRTDRHITYTLVETELSVEELASRMKEELTRNLKEEWHKGDEWFVGVYVNDPEDDDLPCVNKVLSNMDGVAVFPTIVVYMDYMPKK